MSTSDLFQRLNLLSQRLANALDLDEANGVVVDAPVELLNARGAALWLFDGAGASALATSRGLESNSLSALTREQALDESFSANGADWLVVSLRRNERLIGALTIALAESAPSREEMELLRAWAHQASAVIEAHRQRALETIAFREVDRGVRTNMGVRELIERLLNQMISACDAEGGAIYLYDASAHRVEPWVTSGMATREAFARTVIQNRRAETMADLAGGSDWAIGAPMMLGSRIEGAVLLTRSARTGAFPPRSLEILSALSSSAALVVRNAELYARSEEAVIAEERARFAGEMHDGLLQDLGFMVLKIGAANKLLQRGKRQQVSQELREVSRQLSRDAREVRRMVFALRPLDIESLGFVPAMEKYIKDFAQLQDLEVKFTIRGNQQRLEQKLEMAIFRLIQEALNNIRKHARAKRVWIELEFGANATLDVRDDGRGFQVESALKKAHARPSFGLAQMRERVERAGGNFKIESAAGKGTRLTMELPMRGA